MESPKILIVDDEANVRFILERALSKSGYDVDSAADGKEAIEKISKTAYDLLLLDLEMRPVGGMEVLNAVHSLDPDMIVIILTAHSTVESAVKALKLRVFDYLFKPASPDAIRAVVRKGLIQRQQAQRHTQLLSKVEVLRQTFFDLESETNILEEHQNPDRYHKSGKLIIDSQHRIATFDGRTLDLTTTEFNLLAYLVRQAPQPVSPRQLVNHALDYDTEDAEALEIIKWHIHHLRRKIEPDPRRPRLIKTIRYKGYVWSGG